MRTPILLAAGAITLGLLATFVLGRSSAYPTPSAAPHGAVLDAQQPIAASRFVVPATAVNGIDVAEVSGLAWDADERWLYAVSDQGYVYHFRIQLDGTAIVSIKPVFAAALIDPKTGEGMAGSGKHFNAEGLAVRQGDNGIRGDNELIVALEEDPPQIARFSPTGTLLGKLPVPSPANDSSNYQKKNRGLESVARHPVFDLLTAPEAPLRMRPAHLHTVYANGHEWSFARYAKGSRLKGLAVLPDGNLLVLERSRYGSSKDLQVASLRRVDLATCHAHGACKATLLAALPPGPENFEGVALLGAHQALLASDNGDDAAQGTTFVLITLP